MRFLLDMNMPPSFAERLQAEGHDAIHVLHGGLGDLPDREIFEHSAADDRIVVTFDLDFGEIAGAVGEPARGDIAPSEIGPSSVSVGPTSDRHRRNQRGPAGWRHRVGRRQPHPDQAGRIRGEHLTFEPALCIGRGSHELAAGTGSIARARAAGPGARRAGAGPRQHDAPAHRAGAHRRLRRALLSAKAAPAAAPVFRTLRRLMVIWVMAPPQIAAGRVSAIPSHRIADSPEAAG